MKPDVVVVGAGAAGIMAAWRAATLGAKVLLVEKTNRIGTKILVSGGGKCNLAHAGDIEDVIKAFRPNEARFIRPACFRLRNTQIVEMFTSQGMEVYSRPDGRIFPVHQTAKDVVAILGGYLERVAVDVRFESPAKEIQSSDGKIVGLQLGRSRVQSAPSPTADEGYRSKGAKNLLKELDRIDVVNEPGEFIATSQIVVCAGGSSYPNSGTTGDGWGWAKSIGHTVQRVHAALAPIYLFPEFGASELAGVALRDIKLRARQGKEIASWTGDLLFTHQGISGPTALGISRIVEEGMMSAPVSLEIDLLPALPFEELDRQILTFSQQNPNRKVTAFFDGRIVDRILDRVIHSALIPSEATCGKLDRKSRIRLGNICKAFPLGNVRHVPLEKGEVVAGGITLEEVDPQTMRSKIVTGLYLCGEVLDIAGPVGGYNLQAAFATGYLAGETAARDALNLTLAGGSL